MSINRLWTMEHTFTFDAAHCLDPAKLPAGHPCTRLHGHCWKVTLRVGASVLDSRDFVMDFKDLKESVARYMHTHFDHRLLNDVFEPNPTCERLAQFIYIYLAQALPLYVHAASVTVQETEGNAVTYREWTDGT